MVQRQYTDEEIRAEYRQAAKPEKQIRILAELNNCSPDEIRRILGLEEEQMKQKIDWDALFSELEAGAGAKDLAKQYDVSVATIYRAKAQREKGSEKRQEAGVKAEIGQDIGEGNHQADCNPQSLAIPEENQKPGDQERIAIVLQMALPTDSPEVKRNTKQLVVALAEQAADKVLKGGYSHGESGEQHDPGSVPANAGV